MRLNRNFCRKPWPGLQRSCPDPRGPLDAGISDAEANEILVRMKIHGVFKTTWSDRFPQATRLLTDAPWNLRGTLKEGGRPTLIENRPAEQSNLFHLECGRFVVEDQVGAGSDIKSLVTELA